MPDKVWAVVLAVLSSCKQLGWLYLSQNALNSCLHQFSPGKINMTRLQLINISLTAADVKHLTCLVRSGFWFDNLHLSDNNLQEAETEIQELIEVCCSQVFVSTNTMNLYLKKHQPV